MTALTSFFSILLNLALTALPVMAAVILTRWVLIKCGTPKKYVFALWSLTAFRLCCPVAFSSVLSVFNAVSPAADATSKMSAAGNANLSAVTYGALGSAANQVQAASGQSVQNVASAAQLTPVAIALYIAAIAWFIGFVSMLIYSVVSYFRLKRQLSCAVLREENVHECDNLPTPFVLGWVRPKIYIPFRLPDEERNYVLLHERTHLRRGDPLWKLLAFLILAVYWWNPAAWVCWLLFNRDMEMACDEAVLHQLGAESKRGYSLSLVRFASIRRFSTATPLAFGENDAKSRIKNVLDWKRATPGIAFLAGMLSLILVITCCTNADTAHNLRWKSGKFDNISGGTVTFLYRTGSDVQYVNYYEDIYEGGALTSSHYILSGGVAGEEWKSNLSLTLSASPNLDWTLNDGGAATTWTTPLTDTSYGGRTVCTPVSKKQSLGSGSNLILAAVYQETGARDKEVYAAPCEAVLQDLDKVISKNDVVVLIRMETSDTPPINSDASAVSHAASQMYELAQDDTPEALIEDLLCRDIWGMPGLSGNYTRSVESGVLRITIQDDDLYSQASEYMPCNAAILMALRPELAEVQWNSTSGKSAGQSERAGAAGHLLPSGASLEDYGISPAMVQELIGLLDSGQTTGGGTSATLSTITGETPTGDVPYPPMSGQVIQVSYDLLENVQTLALECVTYHKGIRTADTFPEVYTFHQTSSLADGGEKRLTRQGRLWLTYYPWRAVGGWDRADFALLPWTEAADSEGSPLAQWSTEIPAPDSGDTYDRSQIGLDGALSVDADSSSVLFAACFNGMDQGGMSAVILGTQLNDPEALAGVIADNDLVILIRLSLSTAENTVSYEPGTGTFTDILGYNGIQVTTCTDYGWGSRTYYGQASDGSLTPIAESFGFLNKLDGKQPEDYSVDLDGDGQKELVCNVTYNGDGARRAYVYQRRSDGIYRGDLSTEGLPDFNDWGVNASWSEYNADENVFWLHYDQTNGGTAVVKRIGLQGPKFEKYTS
ncbi:peptidase M56 family protein [Oscillibacter valericigenes Sjm18-20]|nr:peptidase M56 family protein [Oscillibacter valericigenes Sjm18-20]